MRFIRHRRLRGAEIGIWHLALAGDLSFLDDADCRRLMMTLLELRKRLTFLLQKVDADRFLTKC